jgi:putative isomerase
MSILTPACFIPLLADLPISDEKAKDMIRKYLLDENKFFGKIPFPSVAYDEPEYIPEKSRWELTWRGATWMPLAWFMLEILDKYGFDEEYKIAMDRIYDMMLEDGQLSELFNSQNGKGLGVPRYGWTAGIFLKMKSVREKKPNNSN